MRTSLGIKSLQCITIDPDPPRMTFCWIIDLSWQGSCCVLYIWMHFCLLLCGSIFVKRASALRGFGCTPRTPHLSSLWYADGWGENAENNHGGDSADTRVVYNDAMVYYNSLCTDPGRYVVCLNAIALFPLVIAHNFKFVCLCLFVYVCATPNQLECLEMLLV